MFAVSRKGAKSQREKFVNSWLLNFSLWARRKGYAERFSRKAAKAQRRIGELVVNELRGIFSRKGAKAQREKFVNSWLLNFSL